MENRERSTIVGVFHNREQANNAAEELKRNGFTDDQIGFAMRQDDTGPGDTTAEEIDRETDQHKGSAVAGGILTGGVLGGLIGAAAALLIPGVGPVVAGGILATALGGAAVGAAAGGLIGALTEMGISEEEARYYDQEFQAGRIIVTVRADGRREDARHILLRHGAYNAESRPVDMERSGWPAAQEDLEYERTATGWEDVSPRYRSAWEQNYAQQGGRWEDDEPYYRYGWQMAQNDRYRGRRWDEVEPELRRDWETRHHDRPWDRAADRIREAWDNATSQRSDSSR